RTPRDPALGRGPDRISRRRAHRLVGPRTRAGLNLRIAIVTDAWYPQINGVVRTLDTVRGELTAQGPVIEVIAPDRFRTVPTPTYPEIPLALFPARKLRRLIEGFAPEAIHIATEGPLGWAARGYCLRRGFPFTTSFHTKFPEYIAARFRVPLRWGYAWM